MTPSRVLMRKQGFQREAVRELCSLIRSSSMGRTKARAPDQRKEWAEEGASGISLGLLPLEWEDHISSREHQQTQVSPIQKRYLGEFSEATTIIF